MAIVFSNNARTTLASGISSSATSITVTDGSVFPSLTGSDIFYCTIDDGTNNEIVEVTAISSNTLTVVRAQDNSTARAFLVGDLIELRLVAKVLETFPQLDGGEFTADEFVGDLRGAVIFKAKAGEAVSKGDAVYVSGISGNTPVVALADADIASKMPAFGLVLTAASLNGSTEVVTFGTISGVDTSAFSVGDTLYVSTTAGELTNSKPAGEASLLQNMGKVQRSHASSGSIKVGGAGRTNDTPNLNDGNIFIGNASNQATTSTLDTSIVPENTNLYYTNARAQAVSINNVVEDTTPQLGGDLASNGNDILFADSDQAMFGSSNDLRIFHNGTASKIQNYTGHFDIQNLADGQDIRFGSDDGAGGVENYFRIDGGDQISVASKNIRFEDGIKSTYGDSDDLQIYHDGSNSFIRDNGDGDLFIEASNNHYIRFINGEYAITTAENAGVGLRYNNVETLATTSTGAEIKEALIVGSSANDLGTTAGNQLTPLTLRSDTANTESLLFTTERLANGTTWTTAAHKIQRKVDATKMGYIQFGSSADDLITFGKNASEYGRFNGSGDFGVGTSNPAYKLHVSGGAGNGIYVDGTQNTSIFLDSNNNTTGPFTIRVDSDAFHIKNQATSGFNTGGSFLKYTDGGSLQFLGDGLVVTSSDFVSIGHTDPDNRLHIQGSGVTGGIFVEDSNNSSASPVIKVQGNRQDTNESQSFTGGLALSSLQTNALANDGKHIGTIYFGTNHTDGTAANIAYSASIAAKLSGAANSATDMPTDLVFYTGSTGRALGTSNQTYGDEAVRITAGGRVGISTNNPLGTLHVNGDIIADANADNGFGFERSGVAYSMLELSATAADELSLFNKLNNDLVFGTNGIERARINNAGDFGLGTDSPDTIMEIKGADPVLTIRDSSTGITDANATLRLAESGGSDTLGAYFDVAMEGQNLTFGHSSDGSAASEQMRLEGTTGDFAIGTTAASGRLHVNKNGVGQIIALFSSDLGTNDRNMQILSPASDSTSAPFEFSTSNSFQFTIDGGAALNVASDKKIGIGTNAPNREIDLTADNPRFQFTDSGLSNCKAEISGNSGHLALQADVGNSQGGSRITFDIDGGEVGRFTTTGGTGRFGVTDATSLNANVHIGSSNATGNATNPALQIGGTTTYRLGLYTQAERGVIDCPNGDDGLDFRVKTAGLAMRALATTGGILVKGTSAFGTGAGTANDITVGMTGTNTTGIKFDTASTAVSGNDRVYLVENKAGDRLAVSTAAGTEILSMLHEGRVGILNDNPSAALDVTGEILGKTFAYSYYNSSSTTLTTSYAVVNLDTLQASTGISGISISSNVVTVSRSGTFMITMDIVTDVTSGAARSVSEAQLYKNGSAVTGTFVGMYNRVNGAGLSTGSATTMVSVSSGDTFEIRAKKTGTDTVVTSIGGTRLTFLQIGN